MKCWMFDMFFSNEKGHRLSGETRTPLPFWWHYNFGNANVKKSLITKYYGWYSLVTVQPGWFCNLDNFQVMSITGHLFSFACPPQYAAFIYLHIGPPRAGKRKIGACFRSSGWSCIKTAKNGKAANGKRGTKWWLASVFSQIYFIRIVCHYTFSQLPHLASLWH